MSASTRLVAPSTTCDVVIAGAGFAGALMAMALRARGFDVVLVERGRHPRFAIGESSTPLANLLLEELCDTYGLEGVRPLTSYGRWRRERPEIARGLKRGFSFFHHLRDEAFADDAWHQRQTLVAASPADDVADTHWYRPDVDAYLTAEAVRLGVRYHDQTVLAASVETPGGVTVTGVSGGEPISVRARFLIDATGPRGLATQLLDVGAAPLRWLPPTQALFAHFEDVRTWAQVAPPDAEAEAPPYPVDAAAVHHVFPGGWIWVLRFDDGRVSAGAALTADLAAEVGAADGLPAWQRLLDRLPSVRAQFADARAITPVWHQPQLAWRAARQHGARWALLPSAAGVIDPLLSTGFPLTLLGIQRLTALLVAHLDDEGALAPALDDYAATCRRELDATERLVAALYARLDDVEGFRQLTLLYFAAASYAESARRLGRHELAPGFLLCDEPHFAAGFGRCVDAAMTASASASDRAALLEAIDETIAPYDVAGLRDVTRRHWYPVDVADLRRARHKLRATEPEIDAMLARCGLQVEPTSHPSAATASWPGALIVVLLALLFGVACQRTPTLTDEQYREAVVAFHTGVAAMQTSQEVLARAQLDRVTTIAEHEPAGWANVGLLLLRQQELEAAIARLERAATLAPDEPRIQRLLALARGREGNLDAAIEHWQQALAQAPEDALTAYALALDLERAGGDARETEALQTMRALAERTDNLAALVETARLAAKRADRDALAWAVGTMDARAGAWPDDIRARFAAVKQAAVADPASAGRPVAFLKNFLLRLPAYRQAVADVSTPREEVGEPLHAFVVLPNPSSHPAPADTALSFTPASLSSITDDAGPARWTGAVSLTGEGLPLPARFDAGGVVILGNAPATVPVGLTGVASDGRWHVQAVDLTYDFRTDLVVAGPGGLRVFVQEEETRFADVTASSGIPQEIADTAVAGVWPADVDLDGDLDLVVGAVTGGPVVLRNNGDTTFAVQRPFADVGDVRGFVWADLDGEGVPDAAFLQADGRLRLLVNRRAGAFADQVVTDAPDAVAAIAAGDAGGDGILDLWLLAADGGLHTLARVETAGAPWRVERMAGITGLPGTPDAGAVGLHIADLDNNGALDVLMSLDGRSVVVLREADRSWIQPVAPLAWRVTDVADVDGDGRLDLLGVDPQGAALRARASGQRKYHWQVIRPRAATAFGDQRINAFGIGGEVEVRTGLHVQKQVIDAPLVHVGLGDATAAEVVRLSWPNGTLQSEFGIAADQVVLATQRLKGSCPWLFAWDGSAMQFVTDVLWRSPLGLRINAQDTADVLMTEDRVKVRGDQLAPRDGAYDLRITAELWETHFFDLVSLLVVDHPDDTEIWVDERFGVPPPSGDVIVTGPVQPVVAARDDTGRDVLATVVARDDVHLDFAGRGRYQGITRTHAVEVELPASVSRTGPLWLLGQGWIHPTDSSINVALSQGRHPAPKGIEVQVAGADGVFRTAAPNIGFPAGKDKTILFDLAPHLPPAGAVRVRLVTNLEIFWDRLAWAVGRPDVPVTPQRLVARTAELRYRGYSATRQATSSTPERPRYVLDGTTPRWRDLEGYHTRFGDVRPLVLDVDDRYVIMNAGDELRVRFDEVGPVPAAQTRDFIVVTDGWEKDGDFNTTFSRTVLPLPTHADGRYDRAPQRLEDDPVYLKHPNDFADYHTRYVTPDAVRDALRVPAHDRTP